MPREPEEQKPPALQRAEPEALQILRGVIAGAEEERDAPHARQGDHGIDDTGDHGGGPAAHPGDEIEPEQTDAAPVECADDGNDQRNAIHDHHVRNLSFPKGTGVPPRFFHTCADVVHPRRMTHIRVRPAWPEPECVFVHSYCGALERLLCIPPLGDFLLL